MDCREGPREVCIWSDRQVKHTKKMSYVITKVKKEFTSGQLSPYSGLSVISDFIKHIGIYDSLNEWFPTVRPPCPPLKWMVLTKEFLW